MAIEHIHRKPRKKDFAGKTVQSFKRQADNMWVFKFTDGSALAVESDLHYGLAIMQVCEYCAGGNT